MGSHIDYSGLQALVDGGRKGGGSKGGGSKGAHPGGLRRALRRFWMWMLVLVVLATLPFFVLVRLGVFAYREWGLGTWPSFALAVAVTSLLLAGYAWGVGRRFGAGKGMRRFLRRSAVGLAIAYAAYGLVYVAGSNVKSDEVRAEYSTLHPLLRVATSVVFMVDPGSVITDAGRTPEDYYLWGLPVNEASLHFPQDDGFVHAVDLRTRGRPDWRNRGLELAFWAFGLHSLRHVGTADHLHVSLRLPGS